MKKIICFLIALSVYGNPFSQTLHLVVVGDITDKTFGTISSQSITEIESIFSTSAKYIDYKLQPIFLTNTSFNSDAVKNAINKIKAQPNDMIVFYYSGYGFYPTNSKSEFPTFKFDDAQKDILSLDEVGDLINQKGVRFGLAIADCMDEEIDIKLVAPPFLAESFLKLAYQKLFLEPCGLMKISASAKGFKNYVYRQQSFFTTGLSKTFGYLDWVRLNEMDDFNLDKVLNDTQNEINIATGRSNQKVIWKKEPCNSLQQSSARKFPSYKNAPTMIKISNSLAILLKTKNETKRKSPIKQIQDSFTINAKINVLTIKTKSEDSQNSITSTYTINQFIDQLKSFNPAIKEFIMEVDGLKRTKDFLKYTEATFTKVME